MPRHGGRAAIAPPRLSRICKNKRSVLAVTLSESAREAELGVDESLWPACRSRVGPWGRAPLEGAVAGPRFFRLRCGVRRLLRMLCVLCPAWIVPAPGDLVEVIRLDGCRSRLDVWGSPVRAFKGGPVRGSIAVLV